MANNIPTRYRVDFERLVMLLLPSLLRRPRQLAWLSLLTMPVRNLYRRFITYEATVRRELSYNSQVLLFEAALNDRFDPAVRRIYITGTDVQLQPLYVNFIIEEQPNPVLYFQSEHQPPAYLYRWIEFTGVADFIVTCPAVLNRRTDQLNALIRRLKLANKKYLLRFV